MIKTAYVRPPIPTAKFDWVAYVEGDEEDGPTGRGAIRPARDTRPQANTLRLAAIVASQKRFAS